MKKHTKKIWSIRGVAILTVMVSIALMMAIVTDLSTKETLKYKIALNERDALQAEALAQSALNFAQIILMLQEPLQNFLTNFAQMGVPLPDYTVWKLLPITSDLIKEFASGSSLFDFSNKDLEKKNNESQTLFGPYKAPEGGYGGFRGSFTSEIVDEESKISIRRWAKLEDLPKRKAIFDQLLNILQKPQNQSLFDGSLNDNNPFNAKSIIGNIYDYTSSEDLAINVDAPAASFGRDKIGDKRVNYANMPNNIKPKNGPFDSMAELRLVPGVSDGVYSVLSKHISVYSESEKINILSVSDDVLGSVFYLCAKDRDSGIFQRPGFEAELISKWNTKKKEGGLNISVEGIQNFLQENKITPDKESCTKSIDTKSKVFSVKASGTVGNVTKTLIMCLRSSGGVNTLYQFQGL